MKGDNEILDSYVKTIYRDGDLISLTSNPKTGKTAFLLEHINYNIRKGKDVVWFDLSYSLEAGHLHNKCVVSRGADDFKDIIKICSVLEPDIVIIDDVSLLKNYDIGKYTLTLKSLCHNNNMTVFLVHQIRVAPGGNKYFHNLPNSIQCLITSKIYMERYKQINKHTNIISITSKRNNEEKRKILIPINLNGHLNEKEHIQYLSELHNMIPFKFKLNQSSKDFYIKENYNNIKKSLIDKNTQTYNKVKSSRKVTLWNE